MSNKKDDTKGLANIGKGILSSLEDINNMEETNKPVRGVANISDKTHSKPFYGLIAIIIKLIKASTN